MTQKQELCLKCKKCCKSLGLHTFYTNMDVDTLQFLQIRGVKLGFYNHGITKDGDPIQFVKAELDMACPHLTENGCDIYAVRPTVCREYDGRNSMGKDECLWSTLTKDDE